MTGANASESSDVTVFRPNRIGVPQALFGLLLGWVFAEIAILIFAAVSGHARHPSPYGTDVASLLGLWTGFGGACVVVSRQLGKGTGLRAQLRSSFGLTIRPLIDVPLGVIVGLLSQYLLVPLLELPLQPFVPNLDHRLGAPARSLTAHVTGPGVVVLGLLVCVGSPFFEELFFRGLLLRGLAGRFAAARYGIGVAFSIVVCGIVFGLVHFEALQLSALIGFGIVLGILAWRTGRLGPGMIAHGVFNAATFVTLVHNH